MLPLEAEVFHHPGEVVPGTRRVHSSCPLQELLAIQLRAGGNRPHGLLRKPLTGHRLPLVDGAATSRAVRAVGKVDPDIGRACVRILHPSFRVALREAPLRGAGLSGRVDGIPRSIRKVLTARCDRAARRVPDARVAPVRASMTTMAKPEPRRSRIISPSSPIPASGYRPARHPDTGRSPGIPRAMYFHRRQAYRPLLRTECPGTRIRKFTDGLEVRDPR